MSVIIIEICKGLVTKLREKPRIDLVKEVMKGLS